MRDRLRLNPSKRTALNVTYAHVQALNGTMCWPNGALVLILAHHRKIHTDVSVSLHEMPLHQQISWIRDDLLDASISVDGSYRDGIQALAVARDAICAIVPSAHPLVHVQVALPTDLVRHPLILFNAESNLGGGSEIENFVDTLGRSHIAFRANSLGTMLTRRARARYRLGRLSPDDGPQAQGIWCCAPLAVPPQAPCWSIVHRRQREPLRLLSHHGNWLISKSLVFSCNFYWRFYIRHWSIGEH